MGSIAIVNDIEEVSNIRPNTRIFWATIRVSSEIKYLD
jgi:hypothetical protein